MLVKAVLDNKDKSSICSGAVVAKQGLIALYAPSAGRKHGRTMAGILSLGQRTQAEKP